MKNQNRLKCLVQICFFFSLPNLFGISPINNVIGDLSFSINFFCQPTIQENESLRIQTHLEYVENHLCRTDVSHLPQKKLDQRSKMISLLNNYWNNGIFPRNYEYPNERKPVFLDKDYNVCAVGYLVQKTVGQKAVEEINSQYKHASIFEIHSELLNNWIDDSGLTKLECAMIQPTYGGGWIIPDPVPIVRPRPTPRPSTELFALELISNQVEVSITENSATTQLNQVFFNPTNHQLQGYYVFPIPKGASIDYFSMHINGQETQGEILDAVKARKIYQDIVNRFNDPALLEYYEHGLFRVKIFPIQPKKEQRIKLTYTYNLPIDNETIEYSFPLKSPASQDYNFLKKFSLKVNIQTQNKIKNIYCPTHEVEIIRKGDKQATIGFEGKNMNTDNDLKLYYNTKKSKIGVSVLNYQPSKEDGYFMMNINSGLDKFQEIINKDLTFVLDASGSMAGEKLDQAKNALLFCIHNLNINDCFNIVRFSTEATSLFDSPQPATEPNIKKAKDYINGFKAIGGTNIDEALELALAHSKRDNRPNSIIFMTDGKPTIGETREEQLIQKIKQHNAENTKIFTFGIGTELNTHLLDKLTETTKGYRTYVLPNEDIEVKVSNFYTNVSSPILTDVKIHFDRSITISDMYPKQVPDFFKGSTISLFGRYKGNGQTTITLEGNVNGNLETFKYPVNFNRSENKHQFISQLWASRAVGYLLDQIRLHGENKELVNEVVRLAKQHGIITPYTSYLILEDERINISNNTIREQDQLLRPRIINTHIEEEAAESYDMMAKSKEGKRSVIASTKIQEMNQTESLSSTSINSSIETTEEEGISELGKLAADIRNINGRAFYQNNNHWTDAQVQENQNIETTRIQFNSSKYFKLLLENPETANYLALGRNVRFVFNNRIYEIYE